MQTQQHPLAQESRSLCYAIEELPASEQQTKISVMASDLSKKIENLPLQNGDCEATPDSRPSTGYAATWTAAALSAGGSLNVRCMFKGKRIFRAEMTWPGEAAVTSEIGTSVLGVLQDLEARLQNDAGDEMLRNGAA